MQRRIVTWLVLVGVAMAALFIAQKSSQAASYLFITYGGPTPTTTPTVTPTPTPTITPTPTATPTPPPPTAEPIYYLTGIGQSSGYYLPNDPTYGQVGLAARIGWAWLQPLKTGAFNWTILDGMQAAAHTANAKWSLSISAGGYSPMWMFPSTGTYLCTQTAIPPGISSEDPPQPPGVAPVGAFQSFQFQWQPTYVYPAGSTICAPVPWDTAYQTAFQNMINTVAAHDGNGYGYGIANDPLLDHVVLTGVNYITQENSLPSCSTFSSTCGVASLGISDVQQWENIITAIPATCTGNSLALCPGFDNATATDYTTRIQAAYTTIAGFWATAFPTKKLAPMYIDGAGFPFITSYPSQTGLKMLNNINTIYGSRAILMNNSASGSSPYIANKLHCFTNGVTGCQPPPTGFVQQSGNIAFQSGPSQIAGAYPGCSTLANLTSLLTAAFNANSEYLELYDNDVHCLDP